MRSKSSVSRFLAMAASREYWYFRREGTLLLSGWANTPTPASGRAGTSRRRGGQKSGDLGHLHAPPSARRRTSSSHRAACRDPLISLRRQGRSRRITTATADHLSREERHERDGTADVRAR